MRAYQRQKYGSKADLNASNLSDSNIGYHHHPSPRDSPRHSPKRSPRQHRHDESSSGPRAQGGTSGGPGGGVGLDVPPVPSFYRATSNANSPRHTHTHSHDRGSASMPGSRTGSPRVERSSGKQSTGSAAEQIRISADRVLSSRAGSATSMSKSFTNVSKTASNAPERTSIESLSSRLGRAPSNVMLESSLGHADVHASASNMSLSSIPSVSSNSAKMRYDKLQKMYERVTGSKENLLS